MYNLEQFKTWCETNQNSAFLVYNALKPSISARAEVTLLYKDRIASLPPVSDWEVQSVSLDGDQVSISFEIPGWTQGKSLPLYFSLEEVMQGLNEDTLLEILTADEDRDRGE